LLFNNQNADEFSGKMLNYASHSFVKKMQKNMLVKPNYAENYASIIGKGLQKSMRNSGKT
jgi:hypothetical protein